MQSKTGDVFTTFCLDGMQKAWIGIMEENKLEVLWYSEGS